MKLVKGRAAGNDGESITLVKVEIAEAEREGLMMTFKLAW